MTKDIVALLVISLLIFVLMHWVITPLTHATGFKAFLVIVFELLVLVIFIAAVEIIARYQFSRQLPIAAQTGFDPGFKSYLEAYQQALPPGSDQQTVQQTLAGYHHRVEERLNGVLVESYKFKYGFLGQPVVEVTYDSAGKLAVIQEGGL